MLEHRLATLTTAEDDPVVSPQPAGAAARSEQHQRRPAGALDRAGFPWVPSHTFRRTVATRHDEAGLSARQTADHLGHTRPSLTQDVYLGRMT